MVEGRGSSRPGGIRPAGAAMGLGIVLVLVLAGCGKHYWHKAGAGADDFVRDSDACAHENFLYASGTKEYGIVLEERYRACLVAHGWSRAQQAEPGPDWFRGVEDEVVRFDTPTPRPQPSPR
jgi:hypothetical protein